MAERQVEIAEADRIEAEEVLKKAKSALAKTEMVKTKADEILTKVNNEVARITGEIKTFGNYLTQTAERLKLTEQNFTKTQQDLSNEVVVLKREFSAELEVLKTRNELMLLADKSKSIGDGASYDELKNRLKRTKDPNLYESIKAETLSVKRFYIGMTRLKTRYLIKDGVKVKPEEFSTNELIIDLLNNEKWQVRAIVAKELGNRKTKGVPDALIKGMKDPNLDVRRNCINSFEKLTGFENPDILDAEYAIRWWPQNKIEVEKNLAEQ